jgi:hypothetical protein
MYDGGSPVTLTGPAKEGAEEQSVVLKGDRLRVRGVLNVTRTAGVRQWATRARAGRGAADARMRGRPLAVWL